MSEFESSVNSEGIETPFQDKYPSREFESSVNSEGIETVQDGNLATDEFESSVNSEGIETRWKQPNTCHGLRAV